MEGRIGSVRRETKELRDDYQKFIAMYEAPTKLYRFLSMRPPTFLRRNLRYVAKKRARAIVPLADFHRSEVDLSSAIKSETWLEIEVSGVDDVGPMLPPATGRPVPGTLELEVYLVNTDYGRAEVKKPNLLGTCKFSEGKKGKISVPSTKLLEYNFSCLLLKVTQVSTTSMTSASPLIPVRRKRASLSSNKKRKSRKVQHRNDNSRAVSREESTLYLEESYVANLVVYDSTHRCLLESGEHQLLLHKEGRLTKFRGGHSTMNWKTIFGMTDEVVLLEEEEPIPANKVLSVTFSWIGGPPSSGYLSDMNVHLSSIRAEYDNKFPKLRRRDAPKPSVDGGRENGDNGLSVVYTFMYDNNQYQQTTVRRSLLCPWCEVRCNLPHDLMMHLKLYHSHFVFSYSPLNGGCKVDVRVNESEKCTQSELDRVLFNTGPVKRQEITELITWKGSQLSRNSTLEDFLPQNCLSVYDLRQFYHSHTCMPILEGEYDDDSENEDNPEWLRTKMMQMVEEFSDISKADKLLMKLWNTHTLKNRIISFKQMSEECKKFVSTYKSDLLGDSNLLVSFKCHLAHLHERGIITGTQIIEIISLIHDNC